MPKYFPIRFRKCVEYPAPVDWLMPFWQPDIVPLRDLSLLRASVDNMRLTKAMAQVLAELGVTRVGDLLVTRYRLPCHSQTTVQGLDDRLLYYHWTIRYAARTPPVVITALRNTGAISRYVRGVLEYEFGVFPYGAAGSATDDVHDKDDSANVKRHLAMWMAWVQQVCTSVSPCIRERLYLGVVATTVNRVDAPPPWNGVDEGWLSIIGSHKDLLDRVLERNNRIRHTMTPAANS